MTILMTLLLLAGAAALVAFGLSAPKLQRLLLGQPREKLKDAGINLEKIVANLAPHNLRKTRKLQSQEIDRVAQRMCIELYVFVSIFFILLIYSLVIAL